MAFCPDLFRYRRRKTVAVDVGGVSIGGDFPIRCQSMGNTDTNDTESSVDQALRIARAGGELVRFTAQGRREAENLGNIRRLLRERGGTVPLVADIHFNPEAAFIAARNVEKVRINPGNFVDKKGESSASETAVRAELEEKLLRLIGVCRENGTALRIGVNHGSLSPRMTDRYGDTPQGMVASCMEFLRICRDAGFDRVVVSMKSSNVRVMVHAYRMLSEAMEKEGMAYPLHLGVTEAGDGEDGRVKSAVGIGALLADGIGDTIRVSLTEAPENEIPVARRIADYFSGRAGHAPITEAGTAHYSPYEFRKRITRRVGGIGGGNPPVVVASGDKRTLDPMPDFFGNDLEKFPVRTIDAADFEKNRQFLRENPESVILLTTENQNPVAAMRAFFLRMEEAGFHHPVLVKRCYGETDLEDLQVKAACDTGMLFLDGLGDGLWIENSGGSIPGEAVVSTAFAILQAARVRITRTEFIACPGCGRTLYDLQSTLAEIKERTGHLTGLKIGVMGCIVNGPGEMADADYGYVGAGPDRVTLYKGKEVVKRNVPSSEAIPELIRLIKNSGDWKDPV